MNDRKRRASGDGTLYFHEAKKLWVTQIDVGKNPAGRRARRTIYAKTRQELRSKIADLKIRGGGTIRPRAAGNVGEWVERWLRDEVKPNRSPNTYALYETMWRVHAQPFIGGKSLERFDVEDVSELFARLRDNGSSPYLVHRVAAVLQRAFEVAVRRRIYTKANPFRLVDKPRCDAKEARALTIEESRRFIAAARADRYEAFWILCLTAGLRLGEALAIEWSDIDFERRTLAIKRSLIEVGGHVQMSPPKTKGSKRNVDLGGLAIEALLRRLSAHDQEGHGTALVFSTLKGTPVRRSPLRQRHFFPILKAAKLGHLRIHDLRHSMTSLAISEGVAPKIVAERLGHSTTRLTQDRYAHVLPGMQRGAADTIDSLLRTEAKP